MNPAAISQLLAFSTERIQPRDGRLGVLQTESCYRRDRSRIVPIAAVVIITYRPRAPLASRRLLVVE